MLAATVYDLMKSAPEMTLGRSISSLPFRHRFIVAC